MDIHQCSVRFNDNNINQHKAWEYLQHRDMKKYPSYAALIAESVVYFIEQDNTRTENKIIEQENKLIDKICKAVQKCIADALSSEILKQVFNSIKIRKIISNLKAIYPMLIGITYAVMIIDI